MLFVVDVGNSHTVSGVLHKNKFIANWRLQSNQDRTADELAIRYNALFQMAQIDPKAIHGFIVSSVVPPLETSWMDFAENYLTTTYKPLAVSNSLNLGGLIIRIENPAEVGADRIVNAVAAWERYHSSLIVVDFGTAITFDCVSSNMEYLGGTIHPGIGISLDALASRTAKLPRLDIGVAPENPIGSSTVKAIHSGMLYGFGGLIDRMVEVLSKEMEPDGKHVHVIATGGMGKLIHPYARSIEVTDKHLTLTGLQILFELNKE
ncbi:type III pantothenate kinase [Desulfogranum japonicum]|uniref:type III pantothenate kinase n=1 Tax=Desulfogranum japonicum TaxID=231447 RepID=UPI000413252F|nr:type III pantothenate kinase [Desulfogranum japonicum]